MSKKQDSEKEFDALICCIGFLLLILFCIRGCLSLDKSSDKEEETQETIIIK